MIGKALFKEGKETLLFLTLFSIILYIIYPLLVLIGIGLIIFVLYFFRDPVREIPKEETVILAPADGIITDVYEVYEDKYIKDNSTCISIFMSPLDVHINRSPINGRVEYIEYKKGKFIMANKPESHAVNEKNYIGINNVEIKVLVIQIAGIMARRIVNWAVIDQTIFKGDKLGMIKFSSGTDLFVPNGIEINVKKGDKVKAGVTIIGRYTK